MLNESIDFPMDPILTPRLTLRRLSLRDANDLFSYCRDPEVARHVLWEAHRTPADSRAYVKYMLRKYRAGEPASWGIELKESGRIVGTIGYMWHQAENRSAEVGYSLAREHWNKGLMTEALAAVIAYSFESLGLNRVEAQHEMSNPASGSVMRKVGMVQEGLLRERLYNKGRYVDVALYAILRSDYAARTRKTRA
ncbi:MAG: GNAT family N-acetyltransferase [Clostridiales bacterium]|nr:GNAT family N-acetyltransferase [Clostridiales bacterium]